MNTTILLDSGIHWNYDYFYSFFTQMCESRVDSFWKFGLYDTAYKLKRVT